MLRGGASQRVRTKIRSPIAMAIGLRTPALRSMDGMGLRVKGLASLRGLLVPPPRRDGRLASFGTTECCRVFDRMMAEPFLCAGVAVADPAIRIGEDDRTPAMTLRDPFGGWSAWVEVTPDGFLTATAALAGSIRARTALPARCNPTMAPITDAAVRIAPNVGSKLRAFLLPMDGRGIHKRVRSTREVMKSGTPDSMRAAAR
jgi:hypothetical protein